MFGNNTASSYYSPTYQRKPPEKPRQAIVGENPLLWSRPLSIPECTKLYNELSVSKRLELGALPQAGDHALLQAWIRS